LVVQNLGPKSYDLGHLKKNSVRVFWKQDKESGKVIRGGKILEKNCDF
jgi:hypothetical protein